MIVRRPIGPAFVIPLASVLPQPAWAAEAASAAGDTAWIIVASALVLLMTCRAWRCSMPGWCAPQAVLSVIMQCFAITCVASLLWLILGYSLAFADSVGGIIGGLGKAFFAGVTAGRP